MTSNVYHLKIEESSIQEKKSLMHIGGKPNIYLPEGLPLCKLCKEMETFFFQLHFPSNHVWESRVMAIFQCTSCYNEDYVIPEMLDGTLKNINIPLNFLEDYQHNFNIVISDECKCTLQNNYKEKNELNSIFPYKIFF